MNDPVILRLINEISEIKDLFLKLEKRFDVCFNNLSLRLNNNNNLHLENHQKLTQSFNNLKDDLERNNPAIKEVYEKIDSIFLQLEKNKTTNNNLNLKIQSLDQHLKENENKITSQDDYILGLSKDLSGVRTYCIKENENLWKNFQKIDSLLQMFKDSIEKITNHNILSDNSLNNAHLSILKTTSLMESLFMMIKNHKQQITENIESQQKHIEIYVNEKISKIPKVKPEVPAEVSSEINIIKLNIENLVKQKNVIEITLRRLLLANQV